MQWRIQVRHAQPLPCLFGARIPHSGHRYRYPSSRVAAGTLRIPPEPVQQEFRSVAPNFHAVAAQAPRVAQLFRAVARLPSRRLSLHDMHDNRPLSTAWPQSLHLAICRASHCPRVLAKGELCESVIPRGGPDGIIEVAEKDALTVDLKLRHVLAALLVPAHAL